MVYFNDYYFVKNTVDSGYVITQQNAPDRIYSQYRNKAKAVKWFSIVKNLAEEISQTSTVLRHLYDIDAATGVQLDILGKIVVVPRNYTGYVQLNPGIFASADNNPAEFGDSSAMFSALSIDQDGQMSDDLYRLAIKSKIIKNNSSATIEDVLFGMNFLLPNADFLRVTDNENMSFSVEFYGSITELERWALLNSTLVPKPQGVKFNGFLEGYDYVQFGDDDQFGDITAQFVGFTGV